QQNYRSYQNSKEAPMALYDIIDEITERQATKTETGDTRMSGVTVGIVANNFDQSMGGRVCVTIPTRDQNANELQWARVAMPSGGMAWGHYFLPEVGDQVLLAFEGGNIEKPYVIGCIQKDTNIFLAQSADMDNRTKRIVTKHGSSITFDDSPLDPEGGMDKITIQTAGRQHTILLDNEGKKIRIADRMGEDYIEMRTEEGAGSLMIKMRSKVTIQVGESVKLILNGESGSVKLEATQFNVEVDNQFMVKSNGMIKIESGSISQKATSAFKIDSGGSVKIAGAPISIG
ncbi:MAG: phage baseplate assembly protein V, partial [Oscillospiraceae bacterium]